MGAHQTLHGDGVKDIAFSVEDCRSLYKVGLYVMCSGRGQIRTVTSESRASTTINLKFISPVLILNAWHPAINKALGCSLLGGQLYMTHVQGQQ